MQTAPLLRCSFCNKSQHDVKRLITGPAAAICDECVDVCDEILLDPVASACAPEEVTVRAVRCSLCGLPSPAEQATPIDNRGALCAGCVSAVRAALT